MISSDSPSASAPVCPELSVSPSPLPAGPSPLEMPLTVPSHPDQHPLTLNTSPGCVHQAILPLMDFIPPNQSCGFTPSARIGTCAPGQCGHGTRGHRSCPGSSLAGDKPNAPLACHGDTQSTIGCAVVATCTRSEPEQSLGAAAQEGPQSC